jgi:hypothetical protein
LNRILRIEGLTGLRKEKCQAKKVLTFEKKNPIEIYRF